MRMLMITGSRRSVQSSVRDSSEQRRDDTVETHNDDDNNVQRNNSRVQVTTTSQSQQIWPTAVSGHRLGPSLSGRGIVRRSPSKQGIP